MKRYELRIERRLARSLRADNFTSNPGSGGNSFASDDISSVHYPRIKLVHGADGTNAGDIAVGNPLPVQVLPVTANGCSLYRSLDLDETEEDVKVTAGTLYAIHFTNTATTTRFLKLYNATAANVTVGSTAPVYTFGIPGNATDDVAGAVPIPSQGIAFSTAICAAATTGAADNDTGAPGAGDLIVNFIFI